MGPEGDNFQGGSVSAVDGQVWPWLGAVPGDPLRPRLEPWRETARLVALERDRWSRRATALAVFTVAYNLVSEELSPLWPPAHFAG